MHERSELGPVNPEKFEALMKACRKAGDEWANEMILGQPGAELGEPING